MPICSRSKRQRPCLATTRSSGMPRARRSKPSCAIPAHGARWFPRPCLAGVAFTLHFNGRREDDRNSPGRLPAPIAGPFANARRLWRLACLSTLSSSPMQTISKSGWRIAYRHARLSNLGTLHTSFPRAVAHLAIDAADFGSGVWRSKVRFPTRETYTARRWLVLGYYAQGLKRI